MGRNKTAFLTDAERQIMQLLWQYQSLSVRQITQLLNANRCELEKAYTTVQTMCKILTDKGYARFDREGRTFIYSPLISEKQAKKTALGAFLNNFFAGSKTSLAQHLIAEDELDLQELEELEQLIKQKRESKQ